MLSLFPGILYLAPFSATILRFGAGICFIYIGYSLLVRRRELAAIRLPIIGHPPVWLICVAGLITVLDGIALFVGYGTQLAAIVGMLIALKHLSLYGRWSAVRPFERSTYALLFLICLTLLISGAGPLGFDLPL
jgi:uncharacterized membrane protein YphA (DoxX/SURF4 family)